MDYLDYLGQKLNDSWKSVKNYFGEDEDQIKFTPHWPSSSPKKTSDTPLLQKEKNIFDSPALNKFVTNNYLDYLGKGPQNGMFMGSEYTGENELGNEEDIEESEYMTELFNKYSEESGYRGNDSFIKGQHYDREKMDEEELKAIETLENSGYFDLVEKNDNKVKEIEKNKGDMLDYYKESMKNDEEWIKNWKEGVREGWWKEEDYTKAIKALVKKGNRDRRWP